MPDDEHRLFSCLRLSWRPPGGGRACVVPRTSILSHSETGGRCGGSRRVVLLAPVSLGDSFVRSFVLCRAVPCRGHAEGGGGKPVSSRVSRSASRNRPASDYFDRKTPSRRASTQNDETPRIGFGTDRTPMWHARSTRCRCGPDRCGQQKQKQRKAVVVGFFLICCIPTQRKATQPNPVQSNPFQQIGRAHV